jgi:NitT/TauT family transport system permease protein
MSDNSEVDVVAKVDSEIVVTKGKGLIRSAKDLIPAVIIVTVLVLLLEFLVQFGFVKSFILPAPSEVFLDLSGNIGYLAFHLGVTLFETLFGFLIAVLVGIITGILIVWSTKIENAVYPLILATQLIPKVAIAPLIVVYFGLGLSSKIVISFLISYFPMVIETTLGLKSVEPDLLNLLNSLKATKTKIFLKVRLPNSLPNIVNGLKISVTLALIGAIVGEFVGGSEGIGYVITLATYMINTPRMFSAILLLIVAGFILFQLMRLVEKVMLPWESEEK